MSDFVCAHSVKYSIQEPEDPRPKSPWTPSYSVSVQGSPMQPAAELVAEVPLVEDEASVADEAPVDKVEATLVEDEPSAIAVPEDALVDASKDSTVEIIVPQVDQPETTPESVTEAAITTETEATIASAEAADAATESVVDTEAEVEAAVIVVTPEVVRLASPLLAVHTKF